ncbi:MAG TPA: HAMP domain-containing histidine kinase [Leucothrix mucor]|nr:HAMP domain-containing histidine kinase [Leucothrix mucor]
MFTSLYSRLTIVLLSIFISMAALQFWLFEQSSTATQNETLQQLHLNLAENIVNDLGIIKKNQFDPELIQQAFHSIMLLGPTLELYVLDKEGNIITFDTEQEVAQRKHIQLQPILNYIEYSRELPIFGDDPRSLDQQKIFSAAAVYEENNSIGNRHTEKLLIGYLYIIIGGKKYDSVTSALRSSNTWKISLIGIISALSFLLIASLLLFYTLTRPLRRLTKEIKAFEQADYPQNISKKQGEIQQLSQSFHYMQQRISQQLSDLKKHDAIRREFLAYVSHDLRTPLAGMKAYLETLELKQDSMSSSERQEFIRKAMTNGDRLQGMIDELFELTRLESQQVEFHQEEFIIGDLLSDIYASLESKAAQENVTLNIDYQQAETQVWGDIAKIERVIQNLSENAIRYSSPASTVSITTNITTDNKLCISIRDQGTGINKENLPYIFEPYFRAPDKFKLKHKGAGLGLAISQRLLNLHNIQLNVESEVGKGTTFCFCLQKV